MRTKGLYPYLVVVLVAMFLVAGCQEQEQDTLRFGLESAPSNLDPRFATDATSARINRLLYQQLVAFDGSLQPIPSLARWERLTPRHYRFTLTEQRRPFHNGGRVTAADVKATYEYVLDPDNGSPHQAALDGIERIETPDENTVDFYLTEPDPLFPGRLVLGILPAELIAEGHPFNRRPVGSGPFELASWPEEGRLRLVRRRDGQRFEFLRVKDPTVRVLKLLRGEIDMLQNDLPQELVGYLKQQPGVKVTRARGSNFTYLGFNMNDPVVGQLAVRKAVAHALNRRAIIEYIMADGARPASALLPPDHWAGNPDLGVYDYDPDKARQWLAKAGYDLAHPARIVYKTSSNPFRVRLATVIQRQLEEVGFEVALRSYDWGTFYGDIKAGRFQMYSLSWVGIKTPDIFRYVFHSSAVPPEGANRGRFISERADRLIEQAEAADDLSAQAEIYRRLQRHLWEELPYVPLWYEDHVFAARTSITGYQMALDGNYDGLAQVSRRQDSAGEKDDEVVATSR